MSALSDTNIIGKAFRNFKPQKMDTEIENKIVEILMKPTLYWFGMKSVPSQLVNDIKNVLVDSKEDKK